MPTVLDNECIDSDSRSDDTDELLTSIDPLIFQSESLVSGKDYVENMWITEAYNEPRTSHRPTIVDDILSSRSQGSLGLSRHETGSLFRTPIPLLLTNIAAHNAVLPDEPGDTGRTISTHLYEASVSAQSTPRTTAYKLQRSSLYSDSANEDFVNDPVDSYSRRACGDGPVAQLQRDLDLSQRELGSAQISCSESRTEVQRMQLTNKQLSTQLQEAKLSIQTLSIQLEQVQQECKHKENTLENLDNTLGRLVAGWKKRDSQKDEEITNLNCQIDSKNHIITESQKCADESKVALANATKGLATEKLKVEQLQKNLGLEIDSLKNERNHIVKDNKELARRYVNLDAELRKLRELCSQKNSSLELIKQQAGGEKAVFEKVIDQLKASLEKSKEVTMNQQLEIQIRDDKIEQMRNEMRILEDELNRNRKELMEKDASYNESKSRMRAMADEHAAALRKLEKDLQVKLQQDFNNSIGNVNEQHKKTLQVHSSNFQTKLKEQAKRHRLELERLRQVAELEITSRLADSQETVAMLRARLDRSEKSVQFWQQEKESVEKARNQISSRLYEIMRLGYRGPDQEPIKHLQDSGLSQPYTSGSKLMSLANVQIPHCTMPNHYFEPIKLDSKCSIGTSIAKSVMGDMPGPKIQNPSVASSINTALSY